MKNIFSGKIYLQGLRKIRTAGIAMSIVLIVLNAWIPIQCIASGPVYGYTDYVKTVGAGQFAPFGMLLLFFAPLLVYNMFSYLNERKSSDFFHALPQKRICIYISFMAAIFTWIISTLCLSALINAILWGMAPIHTFTVGAVFQTILGFLILALVMAGFMALAMTLTGTPVANCLVFLLFFLFIRATGIFFLYGFSGVTPMFRVTHSWLKMFDWEFFLPIGLFVQIVDAEESGAFGNAGLLLYWFCAAVVLLVAAGLAYHYRKSESATKSAPNRIMQNIYRIGVTFPFLMMGALLMILEKDTYLGLLCGVVAFLVWVIFELMTTKKIKNVVRTLPLILVPVIMAGGFVASVYFARNCFYASTPERDEIESVRYDYGNNYGNDHGVTVGGWLDAVMIGMDITDEGILDQVYAAIAQTKESENWTWQGRVEHGYTNVDTLTLTLTSGRKVTYCLRSGFNLYQICRSAAQVQEQQFMFYEAAIEEIHGLDLNQDQHKMIWLAFTEDFKALNLIQKGDYLRLNEKLTENKFKLSVYGNHEGKRFYQSFMLHPDYTPNALKLCMEYYDRRHSSLNGLLQVKEKILQLSAGEVTHASMQIENYIYGKTFSVQCNDFNTIKEFLKYLEVDSHLTDYTSSENVYRFRLDIEYAVDTDGDSKETVTDHAKKMPDHDEEKLKTYDWISEDFYLTFSDADIERYRQIANYPINPLSVD